VDDCQAAKPSTEGTRSERRTDNWSDRDGTVPVTDIESVRVHDNVISLKRATEHSTCFPSKRSVPSRASFSLRCLSPPINGAGIIVGVVDYDIDFMHNNFRNPTVQRVFVFVGPGGVAATPLPQLRLRKGVQRGRSEPSAHDPTSIWPPLGVLMYTCHGHRCWQRASHRQTGCGSRPHLRPYLWRRCREGGSGNLRTLLEAVDYIFTKAAELGKSAVVNLSLGTHGGPHDGSTLAEQGFDVLLKEPGRAIVIAGTWHRMTARPGESRILSWLSNR